MLEELRRLVWIRIQEVDERFDLVGIQVLENADDSTVRRCLSALAFD
jgi:hypothetical protein